MHPLLRNGGLRKLLRTPSQEDQPALAGDDETQARKLWKELRGGELFLRMKPDSPAFQFYPSDFLIGVMGLSDAEIGTYIRLLSIQWVKGGLPSEPAELANLLGSRRPPSERVMTKFKQCEDGQLRNDRLERERVKQAAFRASRAENAAKRWQSTSNARASSVHDGSNALRLHLQSSDVHTPNGVCSAPVRMKRQAIPTKPITDEEWMNGLKTDIAYQHIDIPAEFSKWQRWCARKRKIPTQARFEAWLNNIEKPLVVVANRAPAPKKGVNVW